MTDEASPQTEGAMTTEQAVEALNQSSEVVDNETEEEGQTQDQTESEDQENIQENVLEDSGESDDEPEEPNEDLTEAEAEEETEEHQFSNLSELAEAVGMKLEDFMSTIKAQVSYKGVNEDVSLQELTNGYQKEVSYRKGTMELADQKREFEAQSSEKLTAIDAQLQQAQALAETMANEFLKDYEQFDWATLRVQNPDEYAARKVDYKERVDAYSNLIEHIKQQVAEANQQKQEAVYGKQQESLQTESVKLLEAIPEWNNVETRDKDIKEIDEFLSSQYGFEVGHVNTIPDHRVFLLIKDAIKGRSIPKSEQIARKKIKQLKTNLKPGAKKTSKEVKAQAKSDAVKRFNKNPTAENAAALLN